MVLASARRDGDAWAFVLDGLHSAGGSSAELQVRVSIRNPTPGNTRNAKRGHERSMRTDYIESALKVIADPNILINVVSRRVKQLKRGNRPLVVSLEKLSAEDTALREIAEGKITFELASADEFAPLASPRFSLRTVAPRPVAAP